MENKIVTTGIAALIQNPPFQKLMATIKGLSNDNSDAKMAMMAEVSAMMPKGNPDFSILEYRPMIPTLVAAYGRNEVHKILFLLVKDFCDSFNVKRNMTENQMIECASVLIDISDFTDFDDPCRERRVYRIEDYVMFFAGAKRGRYGKVMDHIDIQIITDMLDDYWLERHQVGEALYNAPKKRLDEVAINHQRSSGLTTLGKALKNMNKKG